ncbi:MAG: ADP-ribosylglycohydrolase family protein [Candidatus Promineifilaceae bacterium]
MNKKELYRGCLLGLAAGDAVGTTLEFKSPGTFEPITDMVGGGPFNLQPGQWTDDTSMALCLAESLIIKRGFDPTDQMERYLRWYREGYLSSTGTCFDIGNTVLNALRHFENTGNSFAGSPDTGTAGNGSLMRLAPVLMFYANDFITALAHAASSSCTTHAASTAVNACQYFGALLIGAFNGESKATLLSPYYTPIPGYWDETFLVPSIAEIAEGSYKKRNPPEIKGTGFVVRSLEAALWAFYNSNNFREGCLMAANLGDDADTTAAIYGQLAGAFYGEQDIPLSWREKLAKRQIIEATADKLYELANAK